MQISKTTLEGAYLVTPEIHTDARGAVFETFRADAFQNAGIAFMPLQTHSVVSKKRNTLRGLNFQLQPAMAKYVRVSRGSAFLVAVDIRENSPTRGKWVGITASAQNALGLYAEAGFARGIQTLEDDTIVEYMSDGLHTGGPEECVLWNDPAIGIEWPIQEPPIISDKAANAPTLEVWTASHARQDGPSGISLQEEWWARETKALFSKEAVSKESGISKTLFEAMVEHIGSVVVEIVPVRKAASGEWEIGYTRRGGTDSHFPNGLHFPGTVQRIWAPTYETVDAAMARLMKGELGAGFLTHIGELGIHERVSPPRGFEYSRVFLMEAQGNIPHIEWYPANVTPEDLLPQHKGELLERIRERLEAIRLGSE